MSELTEVQREKTSNIKKLLFGFPRLGTSIVLGIEGWALLTLYTSGYGLHPFLAGIAITMGYLTIALSQFLLGWISDAKYTKWGRRKPYIIVFAPLLGISIIFLLLPGLVLDLNDSRTLFLWMIIWEIIFRASYAVTTPYQAWMAEEFPVEERPKVSQFQNTFNYIGNGIMALFSMIILTSYIEALDLAGDLNIPIPINLSIPIFIFGILTIVLFYIIAFKMPTEPYYEVKSNLIENLKTIVKNKNFMFIVLMVGISGLGWSMVATTMLKYLQDALNMGIIDYIISAVTLILSMEEINTKKGKKTDFIICLYLCCSFYANIFVRINPDAIIFSIGNSFYNGDRCNSWRVVLISLYSLC